jgi:dUTPase
MSHAQRVQLRILDPRIGTEYPLPQYATEGSAGVDLRAMVDAPTELKPGETQLIPVALPFIWPIRVMRPGGRARGSATNTASCSAIWSA